MTSATRSSSPGVKLCSGAPTRVLRIAPLSFRPVFLPPSADALAEQPGSPCVISSKKQASNRSWSAAAASHSPARQIVDPRVLGRKDVAETRHAAGRAHAQAGVDDQLGAREGAEARHTPA
jgi:hypothetical protein